MHIYFMGVCGAAMGNGALLLRELGHQVTGSDAGIYPPMSTTLDAAGVEILEGYNAARLERLAPDLVVIGNAQSRGNPEIEWLLDQQIIPYVSMPELLQEKVLAGRKNIVVTGTHGKTTTTSLAAFLLERVGQAPGWMIGGVPRDLPNGAQLGAPDAPFVIEGDEYDCAFFDKRSKFIHYHPYILIINNLEFDHADIFRDLADIQRSFSHLLRIVPGNGWVLVNGDDENIAPLLPVSWTRVIKVGRSESCDLQIREFEDTPSGAAFALTWKNGPLQRARLSLSGEFNVRNAAMALVAAMLSRSGDSFSEIDQQLLDYLKDFQGVRRRQEQRFASERLIIVEDFAHHPTAIESTLESLRKRYPDRRLIAAFEPRSNTAVTNIFQYDFADALSKADAAVVAPIHRAERLPQNLRLDPSELAQALTKKGCICHPAQSYEEVAEFLEEMTGAVDQPLVVCFLSNGSFGGVIERFLDHVSA